jgi:hypothetical protein
MSKTLSHEIIPNVDFLSWNLSNVPLRSSAPVLLNKQTRRACRQPHGIARRLGV